MKAAALSFSCHSLSVSHVLRTSHILTQCLENCSSRGGLVYSNSLNWKVFQHLIYCHPLQMARLHSMTLVPPEVELDRCVICGKQIGDEPWFITSTGEVGNRPRERFELVLCASCTQERIPTEFRKLVLELFEKFG